MIRSRKDYLAYLEADRAYLGCKKSFGTWLLDDIWRFQRTLRLLEYYSNCSKSGFVRRLIWLWFLRQSRRLGFSIPINVFGPGLSIAHRGTIVVNPRARVGAYCRLHVCTNIGTSSEGAPHIGDNCYIAPGVKIFGPIRIGDNVVIGANAVVNKSFSEGHVTLGGIPAYVIKKKGLGSPLEWIRARQERL